MRIGLLTIRILVVLAVGTTASDLLAQMGAGQSQPMQAMFTQPTGMGGGNTYTDAYGNPVVVPAQYCGDSCDGGCYDGGSYAGDCGYAPAGDCYGGCADCSGGCDPRWRDGFPNTGCGCGYGGYGYGGAWEDPLSGTNPPFPEDVETYSMLPPGRTEQCGPHYFDVRMEAVTMTRDEAFRTPVAFTSNNVAGPIVLSSTQLDFDYETGFRIIGRYDCGPLSVIEFGYWGLENLDASATVNDPQADLYSIFSNYATPGGVPASTTSSGGALPWTERSVQQTISLESELHNAEFNYRRYWVGFNPSVSGTLLAGFRYTRLREDFRFSTEGSDEVPFGVSSARYDEGIKNDLAGFQAGGDIWIHIRQGVRIGAEAKVGLMNNHYTLNNSFWSTGQNNNSGVPPAFTEHFEKDQPALTVDASADIVWDVCPSWSIRAGYEILFLNSVLLAGENFNTGSVYNTPDYTVPGVTLPQRVPYVNDQGDALYHGAHLGAEYTW
jgi:hypothetical protein